MILINGATPCLLLRRGTAILQHGSIRLEPSAELFAQVFGEEVTVNLPLEQQGEALIQKVVDAMTEAAVECFGVQFVEQPLSETEWEAISIAQHQ